MVAWMGPRLKHMDRGEMKKREEKKKTYHASKMSTERHIEWVAVWLMDPRRMNDVVVLMSLVKKAMRCRSRGRALSSPPQQVLCNAEPAARRNEGQGQGASVVRCAQ